MHHLYHLSAHHFWKKKNKTDSSSERKTKVNFTLCNGITHLHHITQDHSFWMKLKTIILSKLSRTLRSLIQPMPIEKMLNLLGPSKVLSRIYIIFTSLQNLSIIVPVPISGPESAKPTSIRAILQMYNLNKLILFIECITLVRNSTK